MTGPAQLATRRGAHRCSRFAAAVPMAQSHSALQTRTCARAGEEADGTIARVTAPWMRLAIAAIACGAMLSACQTPTKPGASSEPAPRDQPGQPSPQPAPQPTPAPPPPPVIPRTDAEIRQLLDNARNLLDQGQEDAA